jgi:hypothetical protein
MNIYLLSQNENGGYDTFDSLVVVAKSEAKARMIHPSESYGISREDAWGDSDRAYSSWASKPENVTVSHIGKANTGANEGIVITSFNAG